MKLSYKPTEHFVSFLPHTYSKLHVFISIVEIIMIVVNKNRKIIICRSQHFDLFYYMTIFCHLKQSKPILYSGTADGHEQGHQYHMFAYSFESLCLL